MSAFLRHDDYLSGQAAQARAAQAFFAMRLSLAAGVLMFVIKLYAYYLTNSAAILSDAAESVVHLFAVGFAAGSLWFAMKPPDRGHLYGHDRINFFSAGFEGAMIILAALFIVYEATQKWLGGLHLQRLEYGVIYIALAMVINGVLGVYLLRSGRRLHSMVLEANGRHVLSDSLTSFGVVAGLLLTKWTGWLPLDPIVAMLVALHILWSGVDLIRRSVQGLMDSADPEVDDILRRVLDEETARHGVSYHFLRHRNAGNRLAIDFHLQFDNSETIAVAHEKATRIEQAIGRAFGMPTDITSHFEPMEGHNEAHRVRTE